MIAIDIEKLIELIKLLDKIKEYSFKIKLHKTIKNKPFRSRKFKMPKQIQHISQMNMKVDLSTFDGLIFACQRYIDKIPQELRDFLDSIPRRCFTNQPDLLIDLGEADLFVDLLNKILKTYSNGNVLVSPDILNNTLEINFPSEDEARAFMKRLGGFGTMVIGEPEHLLIEDFSMEDDG